MSEPNPTPPSTEKSVAVNNFPSLRRLWTLSIISFAFNGLILVLLVVGIVAHRPHAGFAPGPRWMPPIDRPGFSEMPPPIGGPGSDRIPPPVGGPGFGGIPPPVGGPGFGGMPPPIGGPGFGGMPPPVGGPGFGGMPPPIGGPGFGGMPPPIGGPGSDNMPDTGIGQRPKGPLLPAAMADIVLSRLAEKLTLTDDEKAKIRPIIEQQVADFEKQMEVQHAAVQKQFEDTKAAIKPLLDADQQKQLDSLPLPGPRDG